jgi:hypothetical protein
MNSGHLYKKGNVPGNKQRMGTLSYRSATMILSITILDIIHHPVFYLKLNSTL